MADIIIVAVLAIIVFFILRSQFHKIRRGQCVGGCSGCSGCSGCARCSSNTGSGMETAEGNSPAKECQQQI